MADDTLERLIEAAAIAEQHTVDVVFAASIKSMNSRLKRTLVEIRQAAAAETAWLTAELVLADYRASHR